MDDKRFDQPVKVMFGGPGQIRVVSSTREAAECLISSRWPGTNKPRHLAARLACLAVLEGIKEARVARRAFVQAAEEADILIK